jgi:hypothetical protein
MNLTSDQITLLVALLPIIISVSTVLFHFLVGFLPVRDMDKVSALVNQVVAAVEQSMPGKSGPEKKAAALALAKQALKSFKLPANNEALLNVLIEAAVAQLPDTNNQVPMPLGA